MALCIIAAGKITALAVTAFTLSWTHSVEKVRWEEDWSVQPAGLQLLEARVKGSAAGMEVPDGAMLRDGWWRYAPGRAAQQELRLAQSGATGAGWRLCSAEGCMEIGAVAGEPVELLACAAGRTANGLD